MLLKALRPSSTGRSPVGARCGPMPCAKGGSWPNSDRRCPLGAPRRGEVAARPDADNACCPNRTFKIATQATLGGVGSYKLSTMIPHRLQVLPTEEGINGMNRKNSNTIRAGQHMSN